MPLCFRARSRFIGVRLPIFSEEVVFGDMDYVNVRLPGCSLSENSLGSLVPRAPLARINHLILPLVESRERGGLPMIARRLARCRAPASFMSPAGVASKPAVWQWRRVGFRRIRACRQGNCFSALSGYRLLGSLSCSECAVLFFPCVPAIFGVFGCVLVCVAPGLVGIPGVRGKVPIVLFL